MHNAVADALRRGLEESAQTYKAAAEEHVVKQQARIQELERQLGWLSKYGTLANAEERAQQVTAEAAAAIA